MDLIMCNLNRRLKIHRIAKTARASAELKARRSGFSNNLGGFCARGSAILHRHLSRSGLKSTICFTRGHVWVWCDPFVVDITATQFGIHRDVLIFTEKSLGRIQRIAKSTHPHFWDMEKCEQFKHPSQFRDHQIHIEWTQPNGMITKSEAEVIFSPEDRCRRLAWNLNNS